MFKLNKRDALEAILEMFRPSDNFSVNMAHLSIGKTAISYIGPKLWNGIQRDPTFGF